MHVILNTYSYRVAPYPEIRAAPLVTAGEFSTASLQFAPNPAEFAFPPLISSALASTESLARLQGLQTFSASLQIQPGTPTPMPRAVSHTQILLYNSSVANRPFSLPSTVPRAAAVSPVGSGTTNTAVVPLSTSIKSDLVIEDNTEPDYSFAPLSSWLVWPMIFSLLKCPNDSVQV